MSFEEKKKKKEGAKAVPYINVTPLIDVLPDAERRTLYSKYACHELHLFLFHKDRAFFDAVIRQSIRYAESAERGVSILDYRPELGEPFVDR